VSEQKTRKDDYQKALAAYGQAVKDFHKGDYDKAAESLGTFIDKYPAERELVDRARVYLAISKKRPKKETVTLKTFNDYYQYGVYKINMGEPENALKILEKALEFKEDEGRIFYLMAAAYSRLGQTDACLEHLKKAIQKDKFFSTLAQNESDFEPLWEDKKFKLITRLV
jgi:tetratricopeptide (TPR) repeat protein